MVMSREQRLHRDSVATLAAARQAAPTGWLKIARAMGQSGVASLTSSLLSILSTKILAVAFGPVQLALLATLQQARTIGITFGSLAGQTALVQGASSLEGTERREFVRTVMLLMLAATTIVLSVLALFPQWVAERMGLAAAQSDLIVSLSGVVILGVAYVFVSSILNSAGAVGTLAIVQLAGPASLALIAFLITRNASPGGRAFIKLLTTSALAAVLAASYALWRRSETIRGMLQAEGTWWNWGAARCFFSISGSMFASGLFSSWALTTVRAHVLRTEGLATTGQLDAAWAISMNQAGLILASLQTYYLPAIAGTSDSKMRSEQISRVLTLAVLPAAGLISVLVVLKPLMLTTFYSDAFLGAGTYLRWTLVGDYFKITSWILSIPLIASASMREFLAADLAAYGVFAVTAFKLSVWLNPGEAMSAAFVAMYTAHLLFCGACLWLKKEFRPNSGLVYLWLVGLAMIVVVSAAFWRQV